MSNLNRQFLFRQQHVSQSKAQVAAEATRAFSMDARITAYHANIITDPRFTIAWFASFRLVMNALDNLEARRHVNRMCLAANIPLIESGTAGLLGQASAHLKRVSECFDCTSKAKPTVFPVCTIRSTPSQPIHCVVWAKSFLFAQLFADTEMDQNMSEEGQDTEELQKLKAEEAQLKRLRDRAGDPNYAQQIFDKMFHKDISRLLQVSEMWENRHAPTPLQSAHMEQLIDDTQVKGLDIDHQIWSLRRCYDVFVAACTELGVRAKQEKLDFDKDDHRMMDFVTAATNLRAHIFGIPLKTRFQIKEMAGNIIPAIATTNAIIAGLVVLMARKVLDGKQHEIKTSFLAYSNPRRFLTNESLQPPRPHCAVCSMSFRSVPVDLEKTTLNDILTLAKNDLALGGEITIMDSDARLLYDFDFEDNLSRTLADLKLMNASSLVITEEEDKDGDKAPVHLIIVHDPAKLGAELKSEGDPMRLKPKLPVPPPREEPTSTSTKRQLEEEQGTSAESSASKKTRIEVVDIDDDGDVIQFD